MSMTAHTILAVLIVFIFGICERLWFTRSKLEIRYVIKLLGLLWVVHVVRILWPTQKDALTSIGWETLWAVSYGFALVWGMRIGGKIKIKSPRRKSSPLLAAFRFLILLFIISQ